MNREACISSRRVYNGRIVALRVDEVELPNGRHTVREVLEHPGAVAIVPVDDDGQVVLVRQFRYATGQSLLEIPAGTLTRGEDPIKAAERELREETGLEAERVSLLAEFYPSPGVSTEYMWVFLAQGLRPADGHSEEDEFIEVVRQPLLAVRGLIDSRQIRDAKSIIGLLLATDLLQGRPGASVGRNL